MCFKLILVFGVTFNCYLLNVSFASVKETFFVCDPNGDSLHGTQMAVVAAIMMCEDKE